MLPKVIGPLFGLSVLTLLGTTAFTSRTGSRTEDQFRRYKAVEAYEIRPGILIMPRYTADGEVCEIGIDKRHYSPEVIRHGSDIPRMEIDEIAEELAPMDERGAEVKELAGNEMILVSGHSMTTTSEYENVTIEIDAWMLDSSEKEWKVEQDAAVIKWNHRKCQ